MKNPEGTVPEGGQTARAMHPSFAASPNAGRCTTSLCCGECDSPERRFYVTVVDGPRYALLDGPYLTHQAALDAVDAARRWTEEHYPFSVFYAFGTVSVEGATFPVGVRQKAEVARA